MLHGCGSSSSQLTACLSLQLQGVGAHHQHCPVAIHRVRGQFLIALHRDSSVARGVKYTQRFSRKQGAPGVFVSTSMMPLPEAQFVVSRSELPFQEFTIKLNLFCGLRGHPEDSQPIIHIQFWHPSWSEEVWSVSSLSRGFLHKCTAIAVLSVFFPGLDASSSLLGQRAKNQQEAEQVSFHLCVSSLHLKLRYNLSSPNDGNWGKSSLRAAQPYWSNWLFA